MKIDYENCTNKMLEVEEKCQETQKMCMKLLKQCKLKDDELVGLNQMVEDLQKRYEDELFIYRPLKDDVVDEGLAKYINKAPLALRKKMEFEREAPGVYKYHRKKVFMKIENETIVIRVGGGFLTIDEFVDLYCKGERKGEKSERITNLVYAGKCAGSREFKTFYFEHKDIGDDEDGESSPVMLPKPTNTDNQNQVSNLQCPSILGTPAARDFEREAKMECSNFMISEKNTINMCLKYGKHL